MPIRAFLIAGLLGALITGSLLANTDHLAALRLQQHFAPDDGGANGDLFGSAVAIDGDWAVVGAPGDDSARFVDEGSAYILKLESGTWKIHQKLYVQGDTEAYHPASPINFGQAVAISRDWVAVGAPNYRNSNGSYGRVRLYRLSGTIWTLQQTLSPPQTIQSRRFGSSLALAGEQHLAVGTPAEAGSSLAGQVLTYRWNSSTSVWTSLLQMAGPAVANTGFGRSLAFGDAGVYVGLPGYTPPATPSVTGQVRIYSMASSGPTAPLIHTLVNPAPDEIQRFGGSLAVSDGRLLVGVRGWNIAKQVIACVFHDGSPWMLESKILAPDHFPQIDSDCSVAMNDGIGLVGCPRLLPGGLTEVLLNFFSTVQLPPEYVSRPASSGPLLTGATPDLPQIVATSRQQTLAGNPGYYFNGLTAGGVVPMLSDRPTGPTLVPPLTHLQPNDDFGKRLSADGYTILAAAPRWQNRGTVHVYTRKDGIWDISHSVDNPVTGRYGLRIYGEVMAVSGDWMAISSPQSGGYRILVFAFQGGQWSRTPYVIDRLDGVALREIMSLDISGESLVVVTRASEGWLAGRYSLSESGPVYESKAIAEKPEHIAQEISLSSDRATLMLTNSTANPTPMGPVVYDTSKNPWKKVSTLPLPKGNSPMSPEHSRGLIWAGKSILMANGAPSPVAFMPSGASWTSSLPFQENSSTRPLSMDAEGDLALLSSRSYLRLYSQRSGKWLFAKDLRPEYFYSGDYLASALTQDSLAYGKTPYHPTTYPTLSIYLAAAMEVYDGPTTSGQLIGRDYTLNLGAVALAQDTPLPLTLKNTGDTTWTFAGLEAVPQIATLPSTFQSTPVPPGGTITLPAVLRPIVAGQQTMTLKCRIAGSTTPLATISLSFAAVAILSLPPDNVTVVSRFAALGEPASLHLSSVLNTRSLRFQWFKEGKILPADSTSIFYRAKATAADAGTYAVEITAPDGAKRLIKDIRLGVYLYQEKTLRVAMGGTLSAQAKAWGPGIRYGWNAGPDNASIRGSRTASLQIRNFHPGYLNYGNLQAFAYMGDAGAVIGNWPLDAAILTELYPSGPIELVVGEDAGFISGVIASEAPDNLRFSAQGLPPGVILDPTMGHLTGAPTKPGIYHVTYRASFTGGAAKPATDRILVFPAGDRRLRPGTLVGVVWTGNPGPVEVTNYLEQLVPGMMQIEISTSGRATALWLLGGRRLSAVGQFGELGVDEHCQLIFPPALGLGPLDCRVIISFQTQEINCEVRSELPDGKTLSWVSTLQYRAVPVTTNIREFAGRKTTFFSSSGEDHLQPGGSGFGSMTITDALNVNFVGTLPDGSGITFSSMVLDYGGGISFCASTKAEAFFTGDFSYDLVRGDAFWRRPPSAKDRFYPAGFKAAHYQISAAAYQPPAPGMLLFPQMEPTDGRVSLSLLSSALSSALTSALTSAPTSELHLPGRLTTAHKVNFNAPNLNQAKISFYTPTGFFTGSAVVDDLLPDSETRRQKRAVSFKGMLSSERGEGLFLLPKLPDATAEPPTTTANSPILSGSVMISPAAE